jgi:hypothetical protein
MRWLLILAEALACSGMVFVAHSFFLNSNYLEPAMVKGNKLAYVLALFYYAAFIAVPIKVFSLFT